MNKKMLLILSAIFLLFIGLANAVRLPLDGEQNWDDNSDYGIENWLLISHTENGTLKKGLNVSFDEVNISKNLIVLGNIYGEMPNSFKNSNWTGLYTNEALTRWSKSNFTNAYDNRVDRFSNTNYTLLEDKAFRNENFTGNYDFRGDRFGNTNFSSLYNGILDRFGNLNFTNLYYSITDRFSNLNWTTLYDAKTDRYGNSNFTSQYDNRLDRFGVENGTSLSFSNMQISNISAREVAYFRTENGTRLQFSNYQNANATGIVEGYLPAFFNIGNYTALENSAFKRENYTALEDSAFKIQNYTSLENSAFKIINYTALEDSAYTYANNQSGRESSYFRKENITSASSLNKAVCWKTTTLLGFCSDAPAGDGSCTCN